MSKRVIGKIGKGEERILHYETSFNIRVMKNGINKEGLQKRITNGVTEKITEGEEETPLNIWVTKKRINNEG